VIESILHLRKKDATLLECPSEHRKRAVTADRRLENPVDIDAIGRYRPPRLEHKGGQNIVRLKDTVAVVTGGGGVGQEINVCGGMYFS